MVSKCLAPNPSPTTHKLGKPLTWLWLCCFLSKMEVMTVFTSWSCHEIKCEHFVQCLST